MKFLCGSCRTKYQISDEKVRGKILTIRCKKCGAKILVRESMTRDGLEGTAVAPVADESTGMVSGQSPLSNAFNRALSSHETNDIPVSSDSQPPTSTFEWYTAIEGQQYGPFTFDQVVNQVQQGQLVGRHYVWHDGMSNWTRIRDADGLKQHLPTTTTPPPPPPPEVPTVPAAAGSQKLFSDDLADVAQAPSPMALAGTAPLEPDEKGTNSSEFEPADESIEFQAEDLFASVPRASEADLVKKYNTKFFVKAAGVKRARSRSRLAVAMGAGLIVALLGFFGLWMSGVLDIRLPGIGNPFAGGRSAELYDGEADDVDSVKGLVAAEKKKSAAGRATRRPRSPSGTSLSGDYVTDETSGDMRTRSAAEAQEIDIGELTTGGGVGSAGVGDAKLPAADVSDVPVVQRSQLSPEDIQRTVNSRKSAVKVCFDRALKGQGKVDGKLEIRVTLAPTGNVSRAEVLTPAFKGSSVGKCISEKIRDWRFPSFDGDEPYEFDVPFVLTQSAY